MQHEAATDGKLLSLYSHMSIMVSTGVKDKEGEIRYIKNSKDNGKTVFFMNGIFDKVWELSFWKWIEIYFIVC